jgi:hypothetical protein
MALPLALAVVLVLSIAIFAVIQFAGAGSRDASRFEAGQQAKALAEAGINIALANVAAQYPSADKAGGSGGSLAGGPETYDRGTFTWAATFDATTDRWEVSATGVVENPTGPGAADIVRSASAKISVVLGVSESKFGIYASDPTAPCTELAGSITVNVPVYVASCLTTSGNTGSYPAKIWEPDDPPSVSVHVGGALTANNSARIGTATARVAWVSAGTNVNPANVFALQYPTVPPREELHVDAQTIYDEASWSSATCTLGSQPFDNDNVRNNSRGTVQLLALASYDCTASNGGRLSWDSATKRMEIQGTIFIDGNLRVANGERMQYSGDGTIYFNGKVQIQGVLCGPGSTFNSSTGACSMQWDPLTLGKMMIVAANATTPFDPANAFVIDGSGPRLEVNTWTVGNFRAEAQSELGGAVLVERGYARIAGGGLLKAYITLAGGGAPSLYTLANRATDFR